MVVLFNISLTFRLFFSLIYDFFHHMLNFRSSTSQIDKRRLLPIGTLRPESTSSAAKLHLPPNPHPPSSPSQHPLPPYPLTRHCTDSTRPGSISSSSSGSLGSSSFIHATQIRNKRDQSIIHAKQRYA